MNIIQIKFLDSTYSFIKSKKRKSIRLPFNRYLQLPSSCTAQAYCWLRQWDLKKIKPRDEKKFSLPSHVIAAQGHIGKQWRHVSQAEQKRFAVPTQAGKKRLRWRSARRKKNAGEGKKRSVNSGVTSFLVSSAQTSRSPQACKTKGCIDVTRGATTSKWRRSTHVGRHLDSAFGDVSGKATYFCVSRIQPHA